MANLASELTTRVFGSELVQKQAPKIRGLVASPFSQLVLKASSSVRSGNLSQAAAAGAAAGFGLGLTRGFIQRENERANIASKLSKGEAITKNEARIADQMQRLAVTTADLIEGKGEDVVPTILFANRENIATTRRESIQSLQETLDSSQTRNLSSQEYRITQLKALTRIAEIDLRLELLNDPNWQNILLIKFDSPQTKEQSISQLEQARDSLMQSLTQQEINRFNAREESEQLIGRLMETGISEEEAKTTLASETLNELMSLKKEQLSNYLYTARHEIIQQLNKLGIGKVAVSALIAAPVLALGVAAAGLIGAEALEHLGSLAEQLQIHHGPQTDTIIPKLTEMAHVAPITHLVSDQEHIVSVSPAQPMPDSSHLQTVEPPLAANSNHLNLMGSPNIEAIYDNGDTLGPSNSTIELKDFTGIPSHPEQFASPSPDEQQLYTSVITNPDGSQGIKLTYDGHHVPNSSTWFQCWEKSPAVKGPEQTPSILARLVDNTGKPIEKNQFDFNPNDKSHFVEIANPNNPNETKIVSLDDFTKLTLNQDELESYIDSGAVGTEYGHAAVFNGAITVVDIDQDGEITGHATVSIEQQGFNADQSLQTYESAPPGTSAGLTPEQQGDQEMISADSTTDLSEKITHYETAGTDYEKAGDYPKAASAFEKAGNSTETIGISKQNPAEKINYYTKAINDYRHAGDLEPDATKKADDLSKADNAQQVLDALKQVKPPISETPTPVLTHIPTSTPTPKTTSTPVAQTTATPIPEPTATPLIQTATATNTPTLTPTETQIPTSTPTPPEPTTTQTAEATEISTATALPIISEGSPINGSIETSTPTPIPPTHTPTIGTTFEATATPVSTATPETDKLSHIQEGAPPENTGLLDRIRVDETTIGLAGLSAVSALAIRTALNKKWGPPRNIKEKMSDRIKSFGLPTIAFALVGASMGTRMGVPIGAEAIAAGAAGIAGAGLETTGAIAVGLGKKALGRFKKIPTTKLSTQPKITPSSDTQTSQNQLEKRKKSWTKKLAGTIAVLAVLAGINQVGTTTQHANTITPQRITTPTLQPKPPSKPIYTNTKIPTKTRTLRPTFTHTLTPTPSPRTTATTTFEATKITPATIDIPLPTTKPETIQAFTKIPQLSISEDNIKTITDTLQLIITEEGQVKLYADKNKTREILVVHPKEGSYKGFIDVGATMIDNRIPLTAPTNGTLLMDGQKNLYQHIVYKTKDGKILREDLINYPSDKYDQAQKDFAYINRTASYAQNFHIEPTSSISDKSAVKLYYGSKNVSEFIALDSFGRIDFAKILRDLKKTDPNINIPDSVEFTFNNVTNKASISNKTRNMQTFIAIDNPYNLSLPNPTPVPPSTTIQWPDGKTAGITPLLIRTPSSTTTLETATATRTEVPSPTKETVTVRKGDKLIILGDSITHIAIKGEDNMVNLGVDRVTSKHGVERIKDILAQYPNEKFFCLAYGANNAGEHFKSDEEKQKSLIEFQKDMEYMILTIREAGGIPILARIPLPLVEKGKDGISYMLYDVRDYNQIIDDLIEKYGLPKGPALDQILNGQNEESYRIVNKQQDYVHPSQQGEIAIRKAWEDTLSYLKKNSNSSWKWANFSPYESVNDGEPFE